MDHYYHCLLYTSDQFIDALIERGMEPIPTLYHFEMPVELYEKYNGFASRKVVDIFVELCKKIVDRYACLLYTSWI